MQLYEDIIIRPYITEKSNVEAGSGKYTFVVDKRASKGSIRKAAEMLFNVKVLSVNVQNYDGKAKRQGVHLGRTASWKKAVITIDRNPEPEVYMQKGGKRIQENKKYNSSIEEFGLNQ